MRISQKYQVGLRGVLAAGLAICGWGCDRAAGKNGTTAGPTTQAKAVEVVAAEDVVPVETDPGKLFFRALLYRNASEVNKILGEHPELLEKPVNRVSPLWTACESGSLPVVKALVERGAKLTERNKEDQTVLWAAVSADSIPIVRYLVEKGADARALQDDKETLLWTAASKGMAEYLISAGVDPKHKSALKDTALHRACRQSLRDVVAVLLDAGCDIEQKGNWDMPPLHSAATSVVGEPEAVVRLLLDRGAKINSRGFQGHTALHECAFYGRLEMADLLLGRGAEVEVKDDQGKTPMAIAMENRVAVPTNEAARRRIQMINMLVRHGAEGKILPLPF